ncbi:MAG TPA: beta-ketoacyl-[acyl-carrier-protein] synthase family protein [Burkholderiaceae bacterium]|nr:beta-ketoacyl-[acyl-carrier-protein] synthase family protein [Burkholderiaceae bacterium]
MTRQRIVVTGIGLTSPHGDRPAAVFDSLMQGRSAIALWDRDDVPPVAVARTPFTPERWFNKLQLAGVDRVSQMAVAAGEMARSDAQWPDGIDPERVGVYVGSGMGGAGALDDGYEAFRQNKRVPPLTVVASMANAPAAHLALRVGARGPVYTYSVACASAAVAIAEASEAIASGRVDVAIAGGAESVIVPGVVRAWQAMQALAVPDTEEPSSSCRPFDSTRSGLVLGDGAAMLVLESEQHAQARGVRAYAELSGYGVSCDASHMTKPERDGQVRALQQALARSALVPAQVGYCNAHGTATRVGDVVECDALRHVWGPDVARLRVSSTKSMHGHLLGAAGALEAVITVLALQRGQVPPTASCHDLDPQCDVPVVRGQGIDAPSLDAAISNSFAFGGTNVVLAFKRAHGALSTV